MIATGTPVTAVVDGARYRAAYVASRPDLGGHVVAMNDARCTPGEQFVAERVEPATPAPAVFPCAFPDREHDCHLSGSYHAPARL